MVFVTPSYIVSADIGSSEIRYHWDDWDVESAEEPIDQSLYSSLASVSLRANIAFVAGVAEWIVHRFDPVFSERAPMDYLESAWAQVVSWHYAATTWESYASHSSWEGPVRGVIGTAMLRVHYAIEQAAGFEDPELRGAWISNLAEHVLGGATSFTSWRDAVVERFRSMYPRHADDPLGDVVPREAINPTLAFSLSDTESCVNGFLTAVEPKENPFLQSAQEIVSGRFRGSPYVFDLEEDRRNRPRN